MAAVSSGMSQHLVGEPHPLNDEPRLKVECIGRGSRDQLQEDHPETEDIRRWRRDARLLILGIDVTVLAFGEKKHRGRQHDGGTRAFMECETHSSTSVPRTARPDRTTLASLGRILSVVFTARAASHLASRLRHHRYGVCNHKKKTLDRFRTEHECNKSKYPFFTLSNVHGLLPSLLHCLKLSKINFREPDTSIFMKTDEYSVL